MDNHETVNVKIKFSSSEVNTQTVSSFGEQRAFEKQKVSVGPTAMLPQFTSAAWKTHFLFIKIKIKLRDIFFLNHDKLVDHRFCRFYACSSVTGLVLM